MNAANKKKYLDMIRDITEEPNNMSVEWADMLNAFANLLHEQDEIDADKEIYQIALQKYGAENQILMVFEEMSELQKELCKSLRGKDNVCEIAEEIADVRIMLEQMVFMYGVHGEVKRQHKLKMERLNERIKEAKNE